MADGPKCCKRIFGKYSPFHGSPCSRKGVVERDGKWYCRQHDPEAVKARRLASDAKYEAEWAAERKKRVREAAVAKACEGIKTEALTPGLLVAIRDAWKAVEARHDEEIPRWSSAEAMKKLMAPLMEDECSDES